jgi:hypothetical protein
MKLALSSIDRVICSIRAMLYSANDKMLKDIVSKVEVIPGVKKEIVNGDVVFSFPKTERRTLFRLFKPEDKYSSVELMNDCDNLIDNDHKVSLTELIAVLNELSGKKMSGKMEKSIDRCINQHSSRIIYKFRDGEEEKVLSISVKRMLYVMMHYSPAEISMLSDFESFKEELDIIRGSFVTRGKPLIKEGVKSCVHIRDTLLLSPPGQAGLADLGRIYGGEYRKIDIGKYRGNMEKLLKENPTLFHDYGMMDSYITLKHGNAMEEFYFSLCKLGVPLTSTGIGKSYVLLE